MAAFEIPSLQTSFAIFSWFVLNVSMANVMKATYLHAQVCTVNGVCQPYAFPLAITGLHMMFAWVMCSVYAYVTGGLPNDIREWLRRTYEMVPLALCFAGSTGANNMSLKFIWPSLNQMLSCSGPIVSVFISTAVFGRRFGVWVWLSVIIISVAAALCSLSDANPNLMGISCALVAVVLRSCKSVIQEKLLENLDALMLLFYMAPVAGICLSVVSLSLDGVAPLAIFLDEGATVASSMLTLLWLAMGSLNALFLNLANFFVTRYTGAETLQVLGNVKSVFGIIVPAMLFAGNTLRPVQILLSAVLLAGVYLYSQAKGKPSTLSCGPRLHLLGWCCLTTACYFILGLVGNQACANIFFALPVYSVALPRAPTTSAMNRTHASQQQPVWTHNGGAGLVVTPESEQGTAQEKTTSVTSPTTLTMSSTQASRQPVWFGHGGAGLVDTPESEQGTDEEKPTPVTPTTNMKTEARALAVVSASYGGRGARDRLPTQPPGVKCILYTDRPVSTSNNWTVVHTLYHEQVQKTSPMYDAHGRHSWMNITNSRIRNVMAAKFYKMNMYLLPELQGFDVILWLDADLLKGWYQGFAFADSVLRALGQAEVGIERHPQRNTVAAEVYPAARRSTAYTSYAESYRDIKEALAYEVSQGFDDKQGLYHCGRFMLRTGSPRVRSALQEWWHQVQLHTFRDQISFPWILQHFNLSVQKFRTGQIPKLLTSGHM
mmetsp:Transcript_107067/g.345616  ORF Transcript_107067/g.345616 Transcript_107067/m.345616 type:complete len:717 (+) Transcript_107067:90-2240(+)